MHQMGQSDEEKEGETGKRPKRNRGNRSPHKSTDPKKEERTATSSFIDGSAESKQEEEEVSWNLLYVQKRNWDSKDEATTCTAIKIYCLFCGFLIFLSFCPCSKGPKGSQEEEGKKERDRGRRSQKRLFHHCLLLRHRVLLSRKRTCLPSQLSHRPTVTPPFSLLLFPPSLCG